MKRLKGIFNFYIQSSIHVAFSVCALTCITLFQNKLSFDVPFLFFVFFASITGYNFVKYFGLAKFHHISISNGFRFIQVFSALAFVAMSFFVFQLNHNALFLVIGLAIITFLYAIPFLPKHFLLDAQQNLRQVSGLKIYVIAVVWMSVTVILPFLNNNAYIGTDIYITMTQRFIYVLVLMLPFEIRDLNYDSLKLATIPQQIGIKKTKIIGVFLLIGFFVLEFFKNELTKKSIIATLVVSFITLLALLFAKQQQSKFYAAFWVESIPILWLVILLVLG